jgi:hypothetical protein
MTKSLGLALVGALLLAVTAPSLAWADGPRAAVPSAGAATADASVAAELFAAGKALADAGDHAGACPKFAESARRDARVGTLARLAECEEKLGQYVAARLHWGQARDLAIRTRDARADHAQREYTRVDASVPKVRFTLEGGPPPDLAIAIDSASVDATVLGVAIPVEVGAHAIRATAMGKRPFTSSLVTQADGAVTTVAIRLDDLPPEPVVVPPVPLPSERVVPPPPQPARSTWSGRKTAALVVAGVGIVSIGVGSVTGALSFGSWHDAQNECRGGCSLDFNLAGYNAAVLSKNTAVTEAAVSTAGFITGGVALVGAAVLWLTAPKAERSARADRVHLVPAIGRGTAGLTVGGPL